MMAARLGDYLAACTAAPPPHCPAFARGWLLTLGLEDGAPWAAEPREAIMARARAANGVRRLCAATAGAFGLTPVSAPRVGDVGLILWPCAPDRRRFGLAIAASFGWAMLGLDGVAIAPARHISVWRPHA